MGLHRLPLLDIHPVAHFGYRGDLGDPLGHPLGADRLCHVHAGHLGAEHVVYQDQPHRQTFGECHDVLCAPGVPSLLSRDRQGVL